MDPDFLQIPEVAISSFEKRNDLSVTVHDAASTLWPFLLPERFRHRTACCAAVKARHDWACVDFEVNRLPREIGAHPEGRYHACHAGFVEWVVPAYRESRLAWTLFAGQRRMAGSFGPLIRDTRKTAMPTLKGAALPALVGEGEAEEILEALRQLRARLLQWHNEAAPLLNNQAHRSGTDLATRRLRVRRFIQQRHAGPAPVRDLARELGLGESRTSHLVRELFGAGYLELLTEARLRTAASLLRETDLSVLEVGLSSGFQDASRFHRAFRRRFGVPPGCYRAAAGASS